MNQPITRRTLSRIIMLLVVALLLALTIGWTNDGGKMAVTAQSSHQSVADGFDYPVGKPDAEGWRMSQGFEVYGQVYAGSYHAGEDWVARTGSTAYQPIYAVANGVVKNVGANNYPGKVIVIEHQLPNDEIWYSMYGHVNPGVSADQVVNRGQQVATIYYQGGNSHLHFEIRNFYIRNEVNGSESACSNRHRNYPPGPGYWPVCKARFERPSTKGWVNPSRFINAHRSLNTIAVGQGSSRQATFQRAYDATRQGTTTNITYGTPVATTEFYQPNGWPNGKSAVVRQRFSNDVWLIHDEDADQPNFTIPAYPIYGPIKSHWESNGWLGEPTTNPYRNPGGQLEQHFRFGYVISGGTLETTWATRWPSAQACTDRGLWRLEVTNLLDLGDTRWPPDQNLTAGPSTVVCVDMNKPGYALYHDVGLYEATNPQNQTGDAQGAWGDHWFARITGTINNLPSYGFYRVSAACDDGCDIQIKSATYAGWTQRITSWRDQPAMHLGSMWAQKGDQVDITWYEHTGLARVWLKIGSSALTLPPLATQCDAHIKLADGAPVTNRVTNPLTISAPDAAEMKISHREDMSDATWQPYAPSLEWELAPANEVVTRTVYAQFRDASEQTLCQGAILADNILLDTLPPNGTVNIATNAAMTATLQLVANDQMDGSGIWSVAIQPVTPETPAVDPATLPEEAWQVYSSTITIFKPMSFEGSEPEAHLAAISELTYQISFRDAAGNISEPVTITVPHVESPPDEQPRQIYLPLVIR